MRYCWLLNDQPADTAAWDRLDWAVMGSLVRECPDDLAWTVYGAAILFIVVLGLIEAYLLGRYFIHKGWWR